MDNHIQASGFVVQPRLHFKHTKDRMLYQLFNELANFENSPNCKRGQLITSTLSLSEEIGWTRGDIRGSIKRLVSARYIISEPMKQNKGLLITLTNYDKYQKLGSYNKKTNQQDSQRDNQSDDQRDNQRKEDETSCESKEEGMKNNHSNQQGEQQINQQDNQRDNQTITAFINSIININKTLKEYIADADVKNMNLSSAQDVETFVDFALRTNALPPGTSSKILVAYFDCIRLTRQTCSISAKLLTNFIEKLNKYSVNQIHYALWKHVQDYDDRKEAYTLGILRNVKEPEARRGLMLLKNKKGGLNLNETHQSGNGKQYDYGF